MVAAIGGPAARNPTIGSRAKRLEKERQETEAKKKAAEEAEAKKLEKEAEAKKKAEEKEAEKREREAEKQTAQYKTRIFAEGPLQVRMGKALLAIEEVTASGLPSPVKKKFADLFAEMLPIFPQILQFFKALGQAGGGVPPGPARPA